MTRHSTTKADVTSHVSKDVSEILSILSGLETGGLSKDAPLTTDEQDKLARLLEDGKTKINNKSFKRDTTHMLKEINPLHTNPIDIAPDHEDLFAQVQKHLKLLEKADENRKTLEKELSGAYKTIDSLQQEILSLQDKLSDSDGMMAEMRAHIADQSAEMQAQIEDQTEKIKIAHERLQHEVSVRKQTQLMLREIKLRLVPLTRCRYVKHQK